MSSEIEQRLPHLKRLVKEALDPKAFSLHRQNVRADLNRQGVDTIIALVQYIDQLEADLCKEVRISVDFQDQRNDLQRKLNTIQDLAAANDHSEEARLALIAAEARWP